jgi:hypothetical protein
VGLAILNLLLLLMHEKLHWNFYVSKVMSLLAVLLWTFLAHYFITFSLI